MGAGVATVGRRQYAVGLYWENSPTGRLAQTAREAAKQPGQQADFYAIRPGNKTGRVPQFGLGLESGGHKAGMPAFAGCLANQQPGSWCGAFRLREGTVVTVVRDDLIVPDGDQFFLNEKRFSLNIIYSRYKKERSHFAFRFCRFDVRDATRRDSYVLA
jgi:hypothetical protein